MQEPFALQIYREFLGGKSIAELSGELGIPAERIERRIRAAALYANGVLAPSGRTVQRQVRFRIVRR